MQKWDQEIVQEFCNEINVDKGVLKVWMHNNKNTFAKRDVINGSGGGLSGGVSRPNILLEQAHNNGNGNGNNNNNNVDDENDEHNDDDDNNNNSDMQNLNHYQGTDGGAAGHVGTNGSSSSS